MVIKEQNGQVINSQIAVGQELEVLLADKYTGQIQPLSSKILTDPRIKNSNGNDHAVYEGILEQIEFVSGVSSSIDQLANDMKQRIQATQEIADDYNLVLVPSSIIGPSNVTRVPKYANRLSGYDDLFQDKNETDRLLHISGLHNHISRIAGRETEQYNLMLALDVLFAFASTSPVDDLGNNSLNCSRVNRVRYDIGYRDELSLLDSMLPSYISSLAELELRDISRYQRIKKEIENNKGDVQKFLNSFRVDNTGYHSVRSRPHLPPNGTYEGRAPDSTSLDASLGIAAVYLGANRQLEKGIPLTISDRKEHYQFSKFGITLPTKETLYSLEQAAICSALENHEVNNYLRSVINFAEGALQQKDQKYLQPLREMLDTKRNYANDIMDFLRSDHGYNGQLVTSDMGNAVHLLLADKFKNSYQKSN